MKEKKGFRNDILMLIIGILIGAIIATGVFLVLKEDDKGNDFKNMPNMSENMPARPGENNTSTTNDTENKTENSTN